MQSAGCFAMAVLGISSAEARGLAVSFIEGTQSGDERRYPIPTADRVTIDRTAQRRGTRQGHVYVFALSCPHQNNAVKWLSNDHRFQCTKHDSSISGRRPAHGRARDQESGSVCHPS